MHIQPANHKGKLLK